MSLEAKEAKFMIFLFNYKDTEPKKQNVHLMAGKIIYIASFRAFSNFVKDTQQ